jgi:protein-disulfide isomerase
MVLGGGVLAVALVLVASVATAQPAPRSPSSEVRVEIDGEALPPEEIEGSVALQISKLQNEIMSLRRKAAEDAIARHLLAREAKRRGITVPELLAQEVEAKVSPPTEDEVKALMDARRREVGMTPEQEPVMRERMRTFLAQQKRTQQRERYLASLRSQAKVVVSMPETPMLRLHVPSEGEPSLGPDSAPVTIVEFSDFQCPFCQRTQPTLKELLKAYPTQVRLVYRDFPLTNIHKEARKAAEAARCAGDQGKFWPYHDLLYANPARQRDPDLRRYALDLGLDEPRFAQCLTSGRFAGAVERGLTDGRKLGVTGTPTFFVNGLPLVGAQPLSEFKSVIERELARLQPAAAPRN